MYSNTLYLYCKAFCYIYLNYFHSVAKHNKSLKRTACKPVKFSLVKRRLLTRRYVLLGIAVGRCTVPLAVMYQSHNRALPLHRIQLFGSTPSHVGHPRFLLVLIGVSVVAVLQNSSKNSLIKTSLVNRKQATHNQSQQADGSRISHCFGC